MFKIFFYTPNLGSKSVKNNRDSKVLLNNAGLLKIVKEYIVLSSE